MLTSSTNLASEELGDLLIFEHNETLKQCLSSKVALELPGNGSILKLLEFPRAA